MSNEKKSNFIDDYVCHLSVREIVLSIYFLLKAQRQKNTFEFYIKTRWCHCRIRFNSHLYSSNVERTENRWMRKVTHLIDKPFHYIFLWFYILQNAFLILFIHGNRARCVGMAVNAFLHACYTCESSNYSVYLADSKVTHCECSVCRAGVFSLLSFRLLESTIKEVIEIIRRYLQVTHNTRSSRCKAMTSFSFIMTNSLKPKKKDWKEWTRHEREKRRNISSQQPENPYVGNPTFNKATTFHVNKNRRQKFVHLLCEWVRWK